MSNSMLNLPNRDLKPGRIEFIPAGDRLGWYVEFELPRCSFLDERFKTWIFRESRSVAIFGADVTEIEAYRAAVLGIKHQLDEWLLYLDKAVEHERLEEAKKAHKDAP